MDITTDPKTKLRLKFSLGTCEAETPDFPERQREYELAMDLATGDILVTNMLTMETHVVSFSGIVSAMLQYESDRLRGEIDDPEEVSP